MRALFVLPQLGHPRHHKRVAEVAAAGADVRVLAFRREGDLPPPPGPEAEVIGTLQRGRYISRVLPFIQAQRRIRAAAEQADVIYCFNVDILAAAARATRGMRRPPPLFVEVGDVRSALVGDRPKALALRALERRALADAHTLVVTSSAFVSGYFHGVQGLLDLDWFLLENKMESDAVERPPAPEPEGWDGVLRIVDQGYFGCVKTWAVLERLARRGGDRVQIDLHGRPTEELPTLLDDVAGIDNVTYHGPYQVPVDLPRTLGPADLVWVAHMYRRSNHLWARANRFYQGGYFQRPMVGQVRTQDGAVIERLELGPMIDLAKPDEAVDTLLAITADDMARWRRNVAGADPGLFVYTDEHARLVAAMEAATL